MKRESNRFSQQAINRIAGIAIASQLKQDVEISVDIKTTFKQLAKGQIDAISILIQRLVLSQNLRTQEFQLDIGTVTVKPLSAVKGQIKLLHPSQGKLRVVIDENDLATALNELIQRNASSSSLQPSQTQSLCCSLADEVLTVRQEPNDLPAATKSIGLIAVLASSPEFNQRIVWQPFSASGQPNNQSNDQSNSEWISTVIASLDCLLNLKDFEQKGLFLSVQEVQIADGKLQLNADALIQEFPSD